MVGDRAPDIFMSYASEDLARARALAEALGDLGWSVFWDRKIPTGSSWRKTIGGALDQARCVLVAWSEASVASDWVIQEAEEGERRGILAPILFDVVLPPLGLRHVQATDLSNWRGDVDAPQFRQLVSDLRQLLGSPPSRGREVQGVEVRAAEEPEADLTQAPTGEPDGRSAARTPDAARVIAEAGLALLALNVILTFFLMGVPSCFLFLGSIAVNFGVMSWALPRTAGAGGRIRQSLVAAAIGALASVLMVLLLAGSFGLTRIDEFIELGVWFFLISLALGVLVAVLEPWAT